MDFFNLCDFWPTQAEVDRNFDAIFKGIQMISLFFIFDGLPYKIHLEITLSLLIDAIIHFICDRKIPDVRI